MSIAQNFPEIKPSLNLSFALTKALDPRVTFARASGATYYDGQTVAKAEENLLTYSQEFDNAAWNKGSATVTANATTAPDGTTTADTLTDNATTTYHRVERSNFGTTGANWSYSVYAKDVDIGYVSIGGYASGAVYVGASFDLTTGAVSNTQAAGGITLVSSNIIDVGDGWYRCEIVCTGSVSFVTVALTPDGTLTDRGMKSYLGTGSSAYIWGAQLEQRSAVTAYTPTTTKPITNYIPVLQTASANVARFDHNPVTGESLGLLVEEQRTNLVPYGNMGSAGWTTFNATAIFNTAVSMDGSVSGLSFRSEATTSKHLIQANSISISSATVYTLSVFFKKGSSSWIYVDAYDLGSWPYAYFNIGTGETGNVAASVLSSEIKPVGNGVYRCSFTYTSGGGLAYVRIFNANSNGTTREPNTTGDGSINFYVLGAQLEAGAFPTSYIKTEASQVTRSADSASMTGTNFSDWYRQDEGTMYVEAQGPSVGNDFPLYVYGASNIYRHLININNSYQYQVRDSSTQAQIDGGTVASGFNKICAAYAVNNFAVSLNSGIGTDSVGTVPLVDKMDIGSFTSAFLNGHIRKLAYYPQRLTNEQLQALTS